MNSRAGHAVGAIVLSVCALATSRTAYADADVSGTSFLPGSQVYVTFYASSYVQSQECETAEIDIEISGNDGFYTYYVATDTNSAWDSLQDIQADTYAASTITYELSADYWYYPDYCEPDG